ncbi:nuclear transport factor 2 family protein [Actinosynnema sp. CA-299493]
MNAADVVDRALDHLLAKDMTAFAGLWAETGVIEFPFAPPGYPALVAGRAAVHEYLRGYPDLLDVREIADKVVHRTADPAVVVVEMEAVGFVVATGRPYRLRYIAVVTVRDGEIRHYRDYWNSVAAAEALGGPDRLTAAFAGGPGA